MGLVEILLAFVLILFVLCYNINRLLGLPPGPTPWPIVGNTFQMPKTDLDKHFLVLRKQYGDVFTVWIPFPTVVITGHEALKRTVIRDGDSYAGRPDTFVMILLVQGNYGLIFEENAWYRSQRRFTIHTLRNLGVGKNTIKDTITMLTHRTVHLLQQTNGEPIEIKYYLTNAVGNVIHQLAFGFVRSHDDEEILRFQISLNEVFEHFNDPKMLLLDAMPFLRHFDRWLGLGIKSTLHGNDAILEFIYKQLDQHKRTIDYDQEPTNYIDAYLHEIQRKKKEGVQGYQHGRSENSSIHLRLSTRGVSCRICTLCKFSPNDTKRCGL